MIALLVIAAINFFMAGLNAGHLLNRPNGWSMVGMLAGLGAGAFCSVVALA